MARRRVARAATGVVARPRGMLRSLWRRGDALWRRAGRCALATRRLRGRRAPGRERAARATSRSRSSRRSFPGKQKLAKRSDLVITSATPDRKTIPNIAVTVQGLRRASSDNPAWPTPSRPVFAINGVPKDIGGFPESKDAAPQGGETTYVDTWALGPLKPGRQKTFRWSVTAVRAGPLPAPLRVSGRPRRQGEGRGRRRRRRPAGVFVGHDHDTRRDARRRRRQDRRRGHHASVTRLALAPARS